MRVVVRVVRRLRAVVGRTRGAVLVTRAGRTIQRRGLRGVEMLTAITRLLLMVLLLLLLVVSVMLVIPMLSVLLVLLSVRVSSGVNVVGIRDISVSVSIGIARLTITLSALGEVRRRTSVLVVPIAEFGR